MDERYDTRRPTLPKGEVIVMEIGKPTYTYRSKK